MEGNARTSHEPERQHARQSSPGAGLPAAYPRNSSPNAAPPAAFPRKSSPNAPENSVFRPLWACGANFFALTHTSGRAGRTFSRTEHGHVPTLKPMTPLQALMQTNAKPPSPMQPKNAPKTPISHPQRRRRFQLRLGLREQRRRRFQPSTHTRSERRHQFHHSEAMH